MTRRRVGDAEVGGIGMGVMPLSIPGRPDRDRAVATIHAALDAGVTLLDTADAYTTFEDGPGHNETLIAEALAAYPGDTSQVMVATKGGLVLRAPGEADKVGTREHLQQAASDSRRRLGVESIGLYQLHWPDPQVDYAESLRAIRDLLDEGVIRRAGISNASVAQIQLALEVLDGRLASVQNRFSPDFPDSIGELDHCSQHGIAFLPWRPLGGIGKTEETARRHPAFAEAAAELGVSPQRLTLAWMLTLGPTVIPIPGASRPESIRDSAAAADLELSEDLAERLHASLAAR
ncbi:aldo/keto reductase [Lysobacter korlensis]|uniref:Aldo/keto reductase n=1 Tax=Lysobacter korlensis TaxID=553636 RepID=A0ABV6RVM0_9GAMM